MTNAEPLIHLIQTLQPPIEDLALIYLHKKLLKMDVDWSDVGVLIDDNQKATLVLLLQDNKVEAVLRFCLSVDESAAAIEALRETDGKIYFGCYQGAQFTQEMLCSHNEIDRVWSSIPDQIIEYTLQEITVFYQRLEDDSKKKGRGSHFSEPTKRKVMLESHGRCMFDGCGEDLGFDQLTATEGNFSYLAHNIASSENGERGVVELSGKLSDDPKNILLLCDKHHRLIDKVAAADYPAPRLSKMRRDFCLTAKRLLTGLSYKPIPAFSILWPVHRQVIASPSELQVAQCLAKINARLDSQVNDVSDNESLLREADPATICTMMPKSIEVAADKILMQAHRAGYKAAIFAFGLMPPLVALGAKIGNKSELIPMLRYRDSGQWIWPADTPQGKFYSIEGLENLNERISDVILMLAFTAEPSSFKTASHEISRKTGAKTITIRALAGVMGNGALAHPVDGITFMKDMQKLLHDLKDKHGVNRVHLLPCASNAACVFFGKSFDSHHPEMLVYDLVDNVMLPQLLISNENNKCVIKLPT